MSPKPADRPTAREVLQSTFLPPRVEDEQIKDLIRSLPDNPDTYERVVDAIFAASNSSNPDGLAAIGTAGFNAGGGEASRGGNTGRSSTGGNLGALLGGIALSEMPGAPLNTHVAVADHVVKVVADVCSCHGAVPMASSQVCMTGHHHPLCKLAPIVNMHM